jgi:hypothetical protein
MGRPDKCRATLTAKWESKMNDQLGLVRWLGFLSVAGGIFGTLLVVAFSQTGWCRSQPRSSF